MRVFIFVCGKELDGRVAVRKLMENVVEKVNV